MSQRSSRFVKFMDEIENTMRSGLRMRGYASRHVPTTVGRLHVMEARGQGASPPVVLVHGLSSTGVHFLPLLPSLRAKSQRIILPDLPGHGLSDLPPDGTKIPTLERGLIEMLDEVLTEPAVFVGSSLGGAVAIRYALERPHKVRGLVLSSPAGAQCSRAELSRIVGQFRVANHAMALDFVDRLLNNPRGPMRQILAFGVRARFGHGPLQELLTSMTEEHLIRAEHLRAISVPTLLIWGKNDRILPRSHFEFFKQHLPPGTRIEEPEGVGHAPYLQAPRVLTNSILRFLHEVDLDSERSVGMAA